MSSADLRTVSLVVFSSLVGYRLCQVGICNISASILSYSFGSELDSSHDGSVRLAIIISQSSNEEGNGVEIW
jgi:hypothetical protein